MAGPEACPGICLQVLKGNSIISHQDPVTPPVYVYGEASNGPVPGCQVTLCFGHRFEPEILIAVSDDSSLIQVERVGLWNLQSPTGDDVPLLCGGARFPPGPAPPVG